MSSLSPPITNDFVPAGILRTRALGVGDQSDALETPLRDTKHTRMPNRTAGVSVVVGIERMCVGRFSFQVIHVTTAILTAHQRTKKEIEPKFLFLEDGLSRSMKPMIL